MKLDEKEKKSLILVGILLYVILFFQFNFKSSIPDIMKNKDEINKVQSELDALEKDLKQLKEMQRTTQQLATANERYNDFIAQNSDVLESLEYMEKMKKLFADRILTVQYSPPLSLQAGNTKYYAFDIRFNTVMSIAELNGFSQFLEGGAKKVKITSLNLAPFVAEGPSAAFEPTPEQTLSNENAAFRLDIGISIFSMDLGSIEKLYEMSRNKFEKFVGHDGIVFAPIPPGGIRPGTQMVSFGNSEKPKGRPTGKADISVLINSFFSGGPNYIFVGNQGDNNEVAAFRSKLRQKITINLNDYFYSLAGLDTSGTKFSFSGRIVDKDFYIIAQAEYPEIFENQNLGCDIQIINRSDKNVAIKLMGKTSKFKILDRNGQVVGGSNLTDKIFLL